MNIVSNIYKKIPNVNNLITLILNSSLPSLLNEDITNNNHFSSLINKFICIEIREENSFYILSFVKDNIVVTSANNDQDNNNYDLKISIDLNSIDLLINKQREFDSLLKDEKIIITGDKNLIMPFIYVVSSFDLSLDKILSIYLGDTYGYLASDIIIKIKNKSQNTKQKIKGLISSQMTNYDSEDPFIDHSKNYNNDKFNLGNVLNSLGVKTDFSIEKLENIRGFINIAFDNIISAIESKNDLNNKKYPNENEKNTNIEVDEIVFQKNKE